ncbi:MAG TPA: tRNA (adenosine(37)-N6)-dimethylallyltransferase MiaA [Candidatus Limnocylindria bacterium]|nr:tRNA (adenosine(37)-N6)-dimethylallyltransferase MiaA [Candidatus Limnocylindria bacterium]
MSGPPLLGIVGPTASGKTDLALALALARRLPAEVLVADSRQVYRGMDVGTAKPDAAARAAVPHHLLDLVDPDEPFTVAHWVQAARRLIPEIASRGRLAMVVGGTGLYVSALVDGHDYASQPWSPQVRARLADELDTEGLEPLAARLRRLDPTTTVDLRNPRRVLRALERAEVGGGGVVPHATPYAGAVTLIGLQRPRDVLYRRIDARAEAMFTDGGLLEEVRGLLDAGYSPDLGPMSGHGYREAAAHLAGEWPLEEAIEVTQRRTRQYAKRQLSWFGRDPRIQWLDAGDGPADAPALVDAAVDAARAAGYH